eukprot:16434862-Heterocapsa_arctica.AAC.1
MLAEGAQGGAVFDAGDQRGGRRLTRQHAQRLCSCRLPHGLSRQKCVQVPRAGSRQLNVIPFSLR